MKSRKTGSAANLETIDQCTRALQENPRDSEALYRRGKLHRQNLRYYEAEKDLTLAIDTMGGSVRAHFERGKVRWNQGKVRGALADYFMGVLNFMFHFLQWWP